MSIAAVYWNKKGARTKIQDLRSRIFPSVRRYRLTEPPTCSSRGAGKRREKSKENTRNRF